MRKVYRPGWTAEQWLDLLDVWKRWHLKENVPQHVIEWLESLPDLQPAWV